MLCRQRRMLTVGVERHSPKHPPEPPAQHPSGPPINLFLATTATCRRRRNGDAAGVAVGGRDGGLQAGSQHSLACTAGAAGQLIISVSCGLALYHFFVRLPSRLQGTQRPKRAAIAVSACPQQGGPPQPVGGASGWPGPDLHLDRPQRATGHRRCCAGWAVRQRRHAACGAGRRCWGPSAACGGGWPPPAPHQGTLSRARAAGKHAGEVELVRCCGQTVLS